MTRIQLITFHMHKKVLFVLLDLNTTKDDQEKYQKDYTKVKFTPRQTQKVIVSN